jgi:hypothetical protein
MSSSHEVTFTATLRSRPRGGIAIDLPFDPDSEWGRKDRHYVAGTVGGFAFRGDIAPTGLSSVLELGPSWCRDPRVGPGARVEIRTRPEGPQLDTMSGDITRAIGEDPAARRFFESLATFYRNGYVNWIEAAKRPATRQNRIEATVAALTAGRRERTTR